jgi:hypothetical protein
MGGCGIRRELRQFPEIAARLPEGDDPPGGSVREALGLWLMVARDERGPWMSQDLVAVFDLRGVVWFSSAPEEPSHMWKESKENGRKLLPLVHTFERRVSEGEKNQHEGSSQQG